ncbi:MAG: hypothetical protein KC503_08025, partial [Myxococcales bacterium]|nr:hypothetical protein [Myxococcales bacterium]
MLAALLSCSCEPSFGPAASNTADDSGASTAPDPNRPAAPAASASALGPYDACGSKRFLVRNGCGDDASAEGYYRRVLGGSAQLSLDQWQTRAFGGTAEACLQAGNAGGAAVVGPDGFTYADDPFAALPTQQPAYADGSVQNGALQVVVGGVDEDDIQGMAGGWRKTFTVSAAGPATLRLRYALTISADFEPDERTRVVASIDGTLVDGDGAGYVRQLAGGGQLSTGTQEVQLDLGTLQVGQHTLVVGAHLSQKTTSGELSTLQIEAAEVLQAGQCVSCGGAGAGGGGGGCKKLVSAYFRNARELGFWSEVVCSASVGRDSGGCLARYFSAEGDRGRGIAPLAALAMDIDASGAARFYSFGPDGALAPSAGLDAEGRKHVPESCTSCHGGRSDSASGDLGALFRELDPQYLVASPQQTLAQAQADWYTLNQAIRSANQALGGKATAAASALVAHLDALYVPGQSPPQSRSPAELIPPSWQAGEAALVQAKTNLWNTLVAPYCAGCHRATARDFTDYGAFAGLARQVSGRSLLRHAVGPGESSELLPMPQSEPMSTSLANNTQAQAAIDAWLAAAPADGADTRGPLALLRVSTSGALGARFEVAAIASDDSGVASFELSLDGKKLTDKRYDPASAARTEVFELRDVAPGQRELTLVARDASGNSTTTTLTLTVGDGQGAPSSPPPATPSPDAATPPAATDAGASGDASSGGDAAANEAGASAPPATAPPPPPSSNSGAETQQPEYGYTCTLAAAPWRTFGSSLAPMLLVLLLVASARRRRRRQHGGIARVGWWLLVLAGALAFAVASSPALAKNNGVPGHSGKIAALTCALATCHGDAVAVQSISVDGPTSAEPGQAITLTLNATDGAAAVAAGIGIAASGGELVPNPAAGIVASGQELIHQTPRATNSWTFEFKAQDPGSYTIYAATILGNGDGDAGGDRFGMTTATITVAAGASAQPPPPPPENNNDTPPANTEPPGTPPTPPAGAGEPPATTPGQRANDEIVFGGCQQAPSRPPFGWEALLLVVLAACARRRRPLGYRSRRRPRTPRAALLASAL